MDIVSPEKRSAMMAAVRSKHTGPEMLVRRGLHERGFRYRLHDKKLPGCPDLVLAKWRAVVFVHGCFWHGHGCAYARTPKSNEQFWSEKIKGNVARDIAAREALRAAGWRIFEVWTCDIKKARQAGLPKLLDRLAAGISAPERRS